MKIMAWKIVGWNWGEPSTLYLAILNLISLLYDFYQNLKLFLNILVYPALS